MVYSNSVVFLFKESKLMSMKYILFLLSLTFGTCSWAQEKMDLPKAISVGLENNFGIKINDRFILIAENNNTWARAGKYPTVDLNSNFNNTLTSDNNPASFLRGEFYNGGINLSANAQWVVYNGGRVKIVKDQLTMAIAQQKLTKESEIHDLLRVIYQQYYDVLFQQERLTVLQSTFNLSKDRLAYEETKREFGASNSFNIIQFENAIFTDSTNLINQLQNIEISKRNLYNTLNVIGFPNYEFDERLSISIEELDVERMKDVLAEENYTLKTLSMIASLNQLNTKIEKTNRKPRVSLNAALTAAENGFQFFGDNPQTGEPFGFLLSNRINGSIGAQATWNLYDGGVRKTNIQNAMVQEDIDHLTLLEAKAQLSNQITILADNYSNQTVLLDLADQQIRLVERNLEITEERYKGGLITSIDFRNVQNQYLNAAFAKVNAIYSLILTKSEIDYLVGSYQ